MHLLISLFVVGVKRDGAVPVVNRRAPRALRSAPSADAAARAEGPLLIHGGGRGGRSAAHFLAPLGGLPSMAVVVAGDVVCSVASAALSLRDVIGERGLADERHASSRQGVG